jgi:hypothetical protein
LRTAAANAQLHASLLRINARRLARQVFAQLAELHANRRHGTRIGFEPASLQKSTVMTGRIGPSVRRISISPAHGDVHVSESSTLNAYCIVSSPVRVKRSVKRMFSLDPWNANLSAKFVVSMTSAS